MNESTPLWLLIANCICGLLLIAWSLVAIVPLIVGRDPLIPGAAFAFALTAAWAVWNARIILKGQP